MEIKTLPAGQPTTIAKPTCKQSTPNEADTVQPSAIERQLAAEKHQADKALEAPPAPVKQSPPKRSHYRLAFPIVSCLIAATFASLILFHQQWPLLPLQRVPWSILTEKSDAPAATDTVVTTSAVTTTDTPATQLQLLQARQQSEKLFEQPGLIGPLVGLYRDILERQPQHHEATVALEQLQQTGIDLVTMYIEKDQYQLALQIAEESLHYFPDLADSAPWRALLTAIRKADPATATQPADKPGTEQPSTNPAPPAITNPITSPTTIPTTDQTAAHQRQEIINQLLQQAIQLRQQGALFAGTNSAAARYQSILALQADEPRATAGLAKLIDDQIASIEQSIVAGGLDIAQAALTEPLRRFPEHPKLQQLSTQLDTLRPLLDAIKVTVLPEQAITTSEDNPAILLVRFNYQNFASGTTVLNIQLRNSLLSTPIAEIPVIVQEKQGTKTVPVTIETLIDKASKGTYQLNFVLAGNTVAKHELSSMF